MPWTKATAHFLIFSSFTKELIDRLISIKGRYIYIMYYTMTMAATARKSIAVAFLERVGGEIRFGREECRTR